MQKSKGKRADCSKDKKLDELPGQLKEGERRINLKTPRWKGDVTIDTTEVQHTIRDYQEQPHANKLDNLEKTGKCLDIHTVPNKSWRNRKPEHIYTK